MACFFLTFASASARGAVGLKGAWAWTVGARGGKWGAGPCKGAFAPPGGLSNYFKINFGKAEMVPTFAFPNRTGKTTGRRGARQTGPEGSGGTDKVQCRTGVRSTIKAEP